MRPDSINAEARTVEIVWTTGATVQRRRWEGWDEIREYDEELIVTPAAVRLCAIRVIRWRVRSPCFNAFTHRASASVSEIRPASSASTSAAAFRLKSRLTRLSACVPTRVVRA